MIIRNAAPVAMLVPSLGIEVAPWETAEVPDGPVPDGFLEVPARKSRAEAPPPEAPASSTPDDPAAPADPAVTT